MAKSFLESFVVLIAIAQLGTCQNCPQNRYGIAQACRWKCFCSDNTPCNIYSGTCRNGCNDRYLGPRCDIAIPPFPTAPKINDPSCDQVTLLWTPMSSENNQFNISNKYVLTVKKKNVLTNLSVPESQTKYTLNLKEAGYKGADYDFSVSTYMKWHGKQFLSLPGPFTSKKIKCQGCPTPNSFGVPECAQKCFCRNKDACHPISGKCPSDCDLQYYGATCSNPIPKFPVAPSVTRSGCHHITISWSTPQAKDVGPDIDKIDKYAIIIIEDGVERTVGLTPTDQSYKLEFKDNVLYKFGVKYYFTSHGKHYVSHRGPLSQEESWLCSDAPFISTFTIDVDNTSLHVRWSAVKGPHRDAKDVQKVILEWRDIKLGDCLSYATPIYNGSLVTAKSNSSHTVETGVFWTLFRVQLTAVSSNGKQTTKSLEATTAERPSNGTVMKFAKETLLKNSAVLTWAPPPCKDRGGVIRGYGVKIKRVQTGKTIVIDFAKTPKYYANYLVPGESYEAAIVPITINSVDDLKYGVWTSFNFIHTDKL